MAVWGCGHQGSRSTLPSNSWIIKCMSSSKYDVGPLTLLCTLTFTPGTDSSIEAMAVWLLRAAQIKAVFPSCKSMLMRKGSQINRIIYRTDVATNVDIKARYSNELFNHILVITSTCENEQGFSILFERRNDHGYKYYSQCCWIYFILYCTSSCMFKSSMVAFFSSLLRDHECPCIKAANNCFEYQACQT